MLLDVPAEVEQFVGDGTQLDADARLIVVFFEFFDKLWMLHECEAMADTLRPQGYGIVEVRFCGIMRAARIEQCLASMKHEGNL